MSEKKYKWHRIATHINEIPFRENNVAVVEAAGKKMCIAKFNDQLFSFACKCPHAGGMLADGYLDIAGNIVCPVHRYKFSLQTGRNTSGEGFYLKRWPVEMRESGIYIGMEENGLFGWF